MKKYILIFSLAITTGLVFTPTASQAFPWAIVKEVLKKVIKAIDLNIQRLQNKTIVLQNAQKALENKLSKTKLDEISGWAKKRKELYKKYYDELSKVKSLIAAYQRVKSILKNQEQLVREFRQAWGLFKRDKHFSPDELEYMYGIYAGIITESMKNIDELMLAVNAWATQMSDAARLEIIDRVANKVAANLRAMRDFNRQNIQVSLQRAQDESDREAVKTLYGIK